MTMKINPRKNRAAWLYEKTGGRCFYCGCQTFNSGFDSTRDWLLTSPSRQYVREHKMPLIRGGTNDRDNLVPSCRGCNAEKGAFNLDEYRLLLGLRVGSLNFRFPFEPEAVVDRDWIICHSDGFERDLHVQMMPSAAQAYALRNGWARGPRGGARA